MHRLRYLASAAALSSGLRNRPWLQALTKAGIVGAATSAEGMRSQPAISSEGVPSQAGTLTRASIGNLVDSGAAPYSASAAFFLATTSVTVSVSVTQATTLLGIARSTLTAITLPWAATIRIHLQARRISEGLVGIGDPIKSMFEPIPPTSPADRATNDIGVKLHSLGESEDCLQMMPNRPFWLKRRMSGLNGSAVQTNDGCSGWALANVSNARLASVSSTTMTPPADRYRHAHSSSKVTLRLLCMLS
jgi:hypothetical protein